MGKSRSATIIIAYLLWTSLRNRCSCPAPDQSRDLPLPPDENSEILTPEAALGLLRQGRPLAEPNDGFMEQLHLYHSMGCPDSIGSHPKYQRWLYQKTVRDSLDINRPPDIDNVRFEDEYEEDSESSVNVGKREIDMKCRKCRRLLAKSNFLIEHEPPRGGDARDCAHLFLHPLSWMRESLKEGELDGRLCCPNPKCGANIGKFAWQGMRCSCGGWVTPGFGLARGRVDEVTVLRKTGHGDASGVAAAAAGIRLPPNMRKDDGHL
jgi:dual specificity phosphatase 12